jgi:hypothetical protein
MSSALAIMPVRSTVPAKPVNIAVPDLSQTLLLKGGSLFVVGGRDGDIETLAATANTVSTSTTPATWTVLFCA